MMYLRSLLVGAVGTAFTVTTVAADVALQLLAFVISTVYEPDAVAEYVAAVPSCAVPFFQMYDEPALAVNITEPPLQKVVAVPDVVIAAVGNAFTVTAICAREFRIH